MKRRKFIKTIAGMACAAVVAPKMLLAKAAPLTESEELQQMYDGLRKNYRPKISSKEFSEGGFYVSEEVHKALIRDVYKTSPLRSLAKEPR